MTDPQSGTVAGVLQTPSETAVPVDNCAAVPVDNCSRCLQPLNTRVFRWGDTEQHVCEADRGSLPIQSLRLQVGDAAMTDYDKHLRGGRSMKVRIVARKEMPRGCQSGLMFKAVGWVSGRPLGGWMDAAWFKPAAGPTSVFGSGVARSQRRT